MLRTFLCLLATFHNTTKYLNDQLQQVLFSALNEDVQNAVLRTQLLADLEEN